MKIHNTFEYELNRSWVYNKYDDIIGETNFVVPTKWLASTFEKLNSERKFSHIYSDFQDFIDIYTPETDGELIYQCAIKDNALIEDLGVVMFYDNRI